MYWVTNRYGLPHPPAPFVAVPVVEEADVQVSVPAAPTDGPPERATRVVASLRIYSLSSGVGAGEGAGEAKTTSSPP